MHLTEPARTTEVFGTFDVVVLGGGPAGIAAAATAARAGAATLLVERYGFLGGMGTAAGVTNFCGLHANRFGTIDQVVHGFADDLLRRIDALGGLKAPHTVFGKINAQAYDTAAYKIAADALLLEAGVSILFHALGAGVVKTADREISALLVETKSGRRAVLGRVFIDGSGDGDLAAWAGAPFEIGGPGRRRHVPLHHVPHQRRRPRRRPQPGLDRLPGADGCRRTTNRRRNSPAKPRSSARRTTTSSGG